MSPILPSRRAVLAGLSATLAVLPRQGASADDVRVLAAAAKRVRLRPEPAPETEVWALGGEVPGPVVRVRHGQELRLRLSNRTSAPLSFHVLGLHGPNSQDGVGGLTQEPVAPGGDGEIRLTPPDPGTFLMRPLVLGGSAEPAERGLTALVIVEEPSPPPVDQELAFVLDDWRLDDVAALAPFGSVPDAAGTGRLGNHVTLNGRALPHRLTFRPNSRIRLRLANGCNARLMQIRFDNLKTFVAAIDSQPTDKFEPLRSMLPFPPGRRYDLILDMPAEPQTAAIVAAIGPGIPLVQFAVEGAPLASRPEPEGLGSNPRLPEQIRLQTALRREIAIRGGARPDASGRLQPFTGDPKTIWSLDGISGAPGIAPLFSVKSGSPVVLHVTNETPFVQALHLHGHAFRLLHNLDDGWEPYWLDVAQILEGRTAKLAFVADKPGKWLLGSTVLERLDSGLWGWFEVT